MELLKSTATNALFNPVFGTVLGTVGGLVNRVINRVGARDIIGSARPIINEKASEIFEAAKEAVGEEFVQKSANVMNTDLLKETLLHTGDALKALSDNYIPSGNALAIPMSEEAKQLLLGNVTQQLKDIVSACDNLPEGTPEAVVKAAQQAALSAREALELLIGDDVTSEAIDKLLASLDTVNQGLGAVETALVSIKDQIVAKAFSEIQSLQDGITYLSNQLFNARESILDVCETNGLMGVVKSLPGAMAATAALASCKTPGKKQPGHTNAVRRTIGYATLALFPGLFSATNVLPSFLNNFGGLAVGMLQGAAVYASYNACKLADFTPGSNLMEVVGLVTTVTSAIYFSSTTYMCNTTADTLSQLFTGATAITMVATGVAITDKLVRFVSRIQLAPEKKGQ